jgi:hypothetical protein
MGRFFPCERCVVHSFPPSRSNASLSLHASFTDVPNFPTLPPHREGMPRLHGRDNPGTATPPLQRAMRQRHLKQPVEHQKCLADGLSLRPDGPRSGLSTIAARTIRSCAYLVRVPDFLRDFLAKHVGLTRELTYNGSRPPTLYT